VKSSKASELMGQLGGSEVEAPVWHHNNHGQMQHLGMALQEASRLGKQPVLEPSLGVHLHLQQCHRLLGCSAFTAAWPEHAIKLF